MQANVFTGFWGKKGLKKKISHLLHKPPIIQFLNFASSETSQCVLVKHSKNLFSIL